MLCACREFHGGGGGGATRTPARTRAGAPVPFDLPPIACWRQYQVPSCPAFTRPKVCLNRGALFTSSVPGLQNSMSVARTSVGCISSL
jgi:hypothetical protein